MLLFKLSLLLVLMSVLLQHVRSQEERKHVEVYLDPNYRGGLLWAGPPADSFSCSALKTELSRKARSLKTNTCIVIFSESSCIGNAKNPSFVLTPGEYPDLSHVSHHNNQTANKMIGAFRECGEYEGGQRWAITFHNKYKDEWLEYYDIEGCYSLPRPRNRDFLDVYGIRSGNCFRLHPAYNCLGGYVTLQGGNSSAHWDLTTIDFENKTRSVSTC